MLIHRSNEEVSVVSPVMSRISPGKTVRAQKAAVLHSTTFISTSDWSVTISVAKGTLVPAEAPVFTLTSFKWHGCTTATKMAYRTPCVLHLASRVVGPQRGASSCSCPLLCFFSFTYSLRKLHPFRSSGTR